MNGIDSRKHVRASVEMPLFCFEVLDHSLHGKPLPTAPSSICNDPISVFVTWRKRKKNTSDFVLRGCKGSVRYPQKLRLALSRFALHSAYEDSRFEPIYRAELPYLQCEVSLLHSFEPIENISNWDIGVHGINIAFKVYSSEAKDAVLFRGSSIFLPSVAPQFGWDHETTICQLISKAGYRGKVDFNLIKYEALRYQSSTYHVDYQDYFAWKRSRTEQNGKDFADALCA